MPLIGAFGNPLYQRACTIILFLFLTCVLILNAWVVDDAYITFRTVDNFVHGRGLIWNPGERVQVFTHPLWMFVVSLCYSVTSEFFFSVIVLSALLTLTSLLIVGAAATHGFRLSHWKEPLLVLAFLSSKASIDYASSGLENSLSYLIAAAFLVKFLSLRQKGSEHHRGAIRVLFFLASLAFVNRFDSALLYFPSLLYVLWISRSTPKSALARDLFIAFSPAIAWVLFSLFYYGSPFPNTAYAKNFSTGFPFSWKVQRGWEYLINSVSWDTGSYCVLGSCAWLAVKERTPQSLASLAGIVLYVIFTVLSAASATHMSGRFLAVPFFMGIVLLVTLASDSRSGLFTCVLLSAYILWSPISAVKFGTSWYRPYDQNPSYIDAKWYAAEEGAALINWRPGKRMPDHVWYHQGEHLREQSQKLQVRVSFGGEAIGYTGFAAGPELYIIDPVGLGDPLLARLPAVRPTDMHRWKSGHFDRAIPRGYVKSIATGGNMIQDADLRQYYEAIRSMTRGDLFSWDRLQVIWNMNLGRYDHLIQLYAEQLTPADEAGPRR